MQTPEEPWIVVGGELSPKMKDFVGKTIDALNVGDEHEQAVKRSGHDYWVRWEYNEEEWSRFDEVDWRSAVRRLIFWIAGFIVVCIISIAIVPWIIDSQDTTLSPLSTVFVASISILPAFVILLIMYIVRCYWPARQRHKARMVGERRVTIGKLSIGSQSMWMAGLHISIQEIFLNLQGVDLLTTKPQVLRFRRKHVGIRQSSWYDRVHVVVPHGHEDEGRRLQQRFYSETIASRKRRAPDEPV